MESADSRLARLHARRHSRRNFRLLWVGQTVSLLGDYTSYVTLPLFVVFLTSSANDLALTYIAETIPTLLLGFVTGVLLDRVRLRPVLILADVVRAAGFLALGLLAAGESPQVWMAFAVAFLTGSAKVFFDSGLQALLPSLVDEDYLTVANSRLQASVALAFPVGTAMGGFLIANAGFGAAFGLNGLTFLVSAVSLLLLRRVPARALSTERNFAKELRRGLVFLWAEPQLRILIIAGTVSNLIAAPLEATFVLLGQDELGFDEFGIALLFASMGIGALVGALVAPRIASVIGLGRNFVAGFVLIGSGFFLVSFAVDLLTAAGAMMLAFFGISLTQISLVTMRQLISPPYMLGRVVAASRTILWASLPLGAGIGGVLAERFGITTLFRTGPIVLIAAGLLLTFTSLWSTRSVEAEQAA